MTADQSAPTLSGEDKAAIRRAIAEGYYDHTADERVFAVVTALRLEWTARTADHAAQLRAVASAAYIRGYGKASADAAQVARVVAAARGAGL